MRKIILVSITTLIFIGCNQKLNEKCDSIVKENAQIEKNIKSYKTAWNAFF